MASFVMEEGDGDTFESELDTFMRLLELYSTRLGYLRTQDPRLHLVRVSATHLYPQYERHFLTKIREFEANIAALQRRIAARR